MTTSVRQTRVGLSQLLAVLVTIVGAVAAWRALQPSLNAPLPTLANQSEERMQDFRDALYFPIREFLGGGNPYDPAAMFAHWPVRQDFNLYQPYHLVLHLPFALPGYRVGAVAFAVVSLLLLVLLAFMAASRVRLRVPFPILVGTGGLAALLLTSQVGKAQLYVGQVNPLVAAGAAGALMLRGSHPRWAAVALAVAWLKPQFGLPLAVLLFARGSRRVVLTGTAIAAAASLPVVVLLTLRGGGIGAFLDVIAANLDHARSTSYGAVDSLTAQRIDLPAVLFRVTGWVAPAAELIALVVVLAASAVLVRRLDRVGAPDTSAIADLLTGLAVVVAVVHQPGDVLITFPSMAVAAAVWWQRRSQPGWRPLGWTILVLAVPYAHLHVVDSLIASVLGARAAVTVDGVAVVMCWIIVLGFAYRLLRTPERVRL
ncbi:MAG: glycosyltransferase 87 family protein [Actinomycetota bacterium]|nr:glycosyltransferase 87 family protein [Actinomycetota bacterium]